MLIPGHIYCLTYQTVNQLIQYKKPHKVHLLFHQATPTQHPSKKPPTKPERTLLYTNSMSDSTTPKSGPNIGGQALLKRRPGTSTEDFRTHYITRHAPIAIPWCLSNGVTYYAQVGQ